MKMEVQFWRNPDHPKICNCCNTNPLKRAVIHIFMSNPHHRCTYKPTNWDKYMTSLAEVTIM